MDNLAEVDTTGAQIIAIDELHFFTDLPVIAGWLRNGGAQIFGTLVGHGVTGEEMETLATLRDAGIAYK